MFYGLKEARAVLIPVAEDPGEHMRPGRLVHAWTLPSRTGIWVGAGRSDAATPRAAGAVSHLQVSAATPRGGGDGGSVNTVPGTAPSQPDHRLQNLRLPLFS